MKHADRNMFKVAVLFIDLDRFKQINDTWGHTAGDELLKEAARRIKSVIRDSDTVARIGGDEFTIILPGIILKESILEITKKIILTLSKSYNINGVFESFVTASIGIAIYPNDATDAEHLIKYADTAMYKAKETGKNGYQFYNHDLSKKAKRITQIDHGLRRAIATNEFELHFQPQICTRTLQLSGAEALLRWNSEQLGPVAPGTFIPVAEETDVIMDIGKWVIEQSCNQIQIWQDQGLYVPKIAINLSCKQLNNKHFSNITLSILKNANVDLNQLEIEITESALIDNPSHALKVLYAIRDMACLLLLMILARVTPP